MTTGTLTRADLTDAKKDLLAILSEYPNEVPGLLAALREGRINGSVYSGTCACLIGTIANVRGINVNLLYRNSSRPAERWFLAIREGHTPENNPITAITTAWVEEWIAAHPVAETSAE